MDKLVFFYIRPRVRNSDWVITFTHAKKEYVVNMKRWQCIFKASAFSELVNKDVKYFRKSLQRINDFYSKVDIEQKPYWYLISRLYYDDLTRMDNERIMKGEWKDNEGRANKSDKKEKKEKELKESNLYIKGVEDFIFFQKNNIPWINYQIEKQWESVYLQKQYEAYNKILSINKIDSNSLDRILEFVKQDKFRNKQIWSITKLLDKNKEWVPYWVVMIDKIKSKIDDAPKVFKIDI